MAKKLRTEAGNEMNKFTFIGLIIPKRYLCHKYNDESILTLYLYPYIIRSLYNGSGELIYYERPDTEGPKMCLYEKSTILAENLNSIHTTLEKALGTKIVVNKIRQLFMIGQTRVHVDSVEDLGDFMELEVVLKDEQTSEEGEKIAFDIMEKLEISKENLISGAYADLLRDK
ncbi:uncharacterized protein isoform X2 [Leptinotarsa decemlineata]|uniref:uncharacterized protein isoform X2 n=1 Tax=Leptinotarsa decemlineata TaxID=7539 RepID=UPI003D30CE10